LTSIFKRFINNNNNNNNNDKIKYNRDDSPDVLKQIKGRSET